MIKKEEILANLGERQERVQRALQNTAPKQPEVRLAIMTCARTMRRCSGRSCVWAFQDRERHFAVYRDSALPVRLCAFFSCNGCDTDYANDPDFKNKIERLVLDDVSIIHLSGCMSHHCPNLDKIRNKIEEYGVCCKLGTH